MMTNDDDNNNKTEMSLYQNLSFGTAFQCCCTTLCQSLKLHVH